MNTDAQRALLDDVDRVCDLVGTTLGPFGTNKLVVESGGRVTATSSGTMLLDRLELDDPATTLLERATGDFRERHGDGATTLTLLTGALLREADALFERGLHPTTVARGYREALAVAVDRLESRARPLSVVGPDAVARTALTGTRNPMTRRRVSEAIADAAATVSASDAPNGGRADLDVLARLGGVGDTDLVPGVVLETPLVSDAMPRRLPDAGVALLSSTVDVPKLGGATESADRDLSLDADTFEERAAIGEYERDEFRRILSSAVASGCRFVATKGGVNDRVKTRLADAGVAAVDRVEDGEMERLVRSTGGRVVPSLAEVTPETMGAADVRVERLAGREFVYVEGDGAPQFSLVCRAPDPRSVAAFEESAESAVAATFRALEDGRVVPGGGATEVDLERAIRTAARGTAGREQLAMEGFAKALVTVPKRLAESAGLDGWSGVIRLRVAHDEGRSSAGVDALAGEIRDVLEGEVIAEPLGLKRDAVASATDLATQLLRVDERVPANDLSDEDSTAAAR
ncbi:HSP60 family chaperonin [Halogeometricum pallidum JCM 14848]|uniref:HSP60 family chaperonin n=1 Tax=Halogeometricum pallidum JCM 14848 TaxID=1227487 RepID=M0CXJ8_HALPD|nr:TCP-1/cpn60 chaperonin family protein [Halogeometricum pallidum]ELZ27940.1 HSP60 family chaperonin [Halogeometricum pallidum JCM 14848]